jgi:hypothetical protein
MPFSGQKTIFLETSVMLIFGDAWPGAAVKE